MRRLFGCVCLTVALRAQTEPGLAATVPPDVPIGKAELQVTAGPVELQVFTYRPATVDGKA